MLTNHVYQGLGLDDETHLGEWYLENNRVQTGRNTMAYHYGAWHDLDLVGAQLPFTVLVDGKVVGCQGLSVSAGPYGMVKEFSTGSWLVPDARGVGLGTAARHAMLHVAFAGFHAHKVRSKATVGNISSQRVSEKTGYHLDGTTNIIVHNQNVTLDRYIITRTMWRNSSRPTTILEGADTILPHLLGFPQQF